MTGPATYASPVLTRERPTLNLPRDIAGLRAECKRRKIEATGSQQDLMSRLNAHELANSRAFSTAVEQAKRPSAESKDAPTPTRHFNTSRTLKAVKDTSTIDFAYFPHVDPDTPLDDYSQMRVPIIPTNYTPNRTGAHAPEQETIVVFKPQINTMSADAVYLPMAADLRDNDNDTVNIDFHAMADKVANNIRRMKVPVEEQAGMMKQLWNEMVDDMLGASQKKASTS
ncbi:hypothetical protein LTR78_006253 [Recurvomyces mirabilis]|uniref:SAP domain-containing protein n=1 Tax=Recurvomyces mirabilis TaxID=574656 RepID=A0AAE1BZZ2_9PEZI|nr:hypothetical protein LTR78_006253 [Recurvomyces mirabilis]KAK5152142.1 hypothetical protein LTS14_008517 [Recurvomyces mirabilis]